jgi:hypothetical protein
MVWTTLHDWINLYPVKVGMMFALLVVLYFIRGGELLPRPLKIWCLFRWMGFKEKRP